MKIYLASRYSRILELRIWREHLQDRGHTVTSRWLDGNHVIHDTSSGPAPDDGDTGILSEAAHTQRLKFAYEDVADVEAADCLIAFTEPPGSPHSRGGRHCETGMAIAWRKRVIVVGYRENIFCWLPEIEFCPDFEAVLVLIGRSKVIDFRAQRPRDHLIDCYDYRYGSRD